MIKFIYKNKNLTSILSSSQQLNSIRMAMTTIDEKAMKYVHKAAGIICPVSPLGSFTTPLLIDVLQVTKRLYPSEKIEIEQEVLTIAKPPIPNTTINQPINPEYQLRDYQLLSAKQALNYGRGIILNPTRSGKSLVTSTVAQSCFNSSIPFETALLVVPNTQLVTQMCKDMNDYGYPDTMEVVRFSSDKHHRELKLDPNKKHLIVSNRQWLEKHNKELPDRIDLLIIDEVQFCSKKSWLTRFVKRFGTRYKLGFTATLPDNIDNVWNIKRLFGAVICNIPPKKLQDDGHLSQVQVIPIKFKHKVKKKFDKEADKSIYLQEVDFFTRDHESNVIITNLASKLTGNTLVLFDTIEYGKKLYSMIDSEHKMHIDGSVAQDYREEVRMLMRERNDYVLVANVACLGVGITIDVLDNIIFLCSGSSTCRVIQALGRGLKPAEGKDCLRLFDVSHNYYYSSKHYRERTKLYFEFYEIDSNEKIKTFNINKNQIKELT